MAIVGDIFAHARATPDKAAVIFNGRPVSYRQFAAFVFLARVFFERQAIRRDRAAVLCVHNRFDGWIIGLALRGLGVTTVIVQSAEAIAMLGLGPVSLILLPTEADAWSGLAAAAARAGGPLILVPADVSAGWQAVDFRGAESIAATPGGGHILLTSGTTGAYKKVLIDQAAEARDVRQRAEVFGLTGDSVVSVFDFGGWTSLGHNMPVCAWSLGASVGFQQGPEHRRFLVTPGLTHAIATPHLLADLLDPAAGNSVRNDAVTLFVGGGVLPPAQWRAARERLTRDVRTFIGCTETGAFCSTAVETADGLPWHRIHPGCEAQVVDDQDRPAPIGETGIVRVRTNGVSGYLGDEQTSRAFFRDGFFYPGDLGVLRADGRLSLQGRVTDVINVLGDKIASAPIEAALQDRLGAEAVCVFSTPGENGEDVHVAIQSGRTIDPADLQAALRAALPPGIADVHVHSVEGFPRNHMGKIERAALKAQLLPKTASP